MSETRVRVFRGWFVVMSAALCLVGCVAEEVVGPVVLLPPEAYRYERFIEAYSRLDADHIVVEVAHAYRKDMVPIVSKDNHTKEVTPDRIKLVNLDDRFAHDSVALTFRNMRIAARKRIEVIFTELSLEQDPPVLLLLVADGVAHLTGDGVDMTADRIVIRNDQVKGFMADGQQYRELEGGY